MQLRHKFFIVLSLLSSIPLLILLFGVVEQMEKEVTARTRAEMQGTLGKMRGEINLIINNQKSIAKGLSRVPAVRTFAVIANNPAAISSKDYSRYAEDLEQFFLNYQHSVPSIQALRFIDKSGKTLVKVKEGKPILASHLDTESGRMYIADQSSRPFFKSAVEGKTTLSMSDFELGQVDRNADFCPAMVRYSVPIRDEVDNLEGVLVVNMWGRRLDATIEAALGGHSVNAYIVELNEDSNRDGIYLYHRETSKRFANQLGSNHRFSNELTADEWQQIKNKHSSGSLFKQDGRMLFYTKISPYQDRQTKWLLVIETGSSNVYAPINKMRRSIWFLLGILLVVSVLIAIWTSDRLTKPVRHLAEIMRGYADGNRALRFDKPRNTEDEIGQAGQAFNYLAEKLESTEKERANAVRAACQSERLAALGQLAAGIGHEINNPLMNIMSLASLVEESLESTETEKKNDLQLLKKEGERCARIVQGILSFAREKKPSYEPFDMAKLLEETLQLLHHRIESANIHLKENIDPDLHMEGDASLLQQVLVNIILNAIQASPEHSVLKINASETNGKIIIEVIDSGAGINNKHYSKIFDPFFTTKEEGEGTGLGLSISYGIIQRHQGNLSIVNNQAGGVVVTISLPVSVNFETSTQVMKEASHAG